jgi:hypothetical protein
VNSPLAGCVFYYVRGEHRERPYHFSIEASSEKEIRCIILADEPKAIKIEIKRLADTYVDGKGYILRPAGSTQTPDLIEEGNAYILFE